MVMDEATAAKVDHLDLAVRVRLDQDVLWLQVAVDQLEVVTEGQRFQNLLRNLLESWNVEVKLFLDLSVIL